MFMSFSSLEILEIFFRMRMGFMVALFAVLIRVSPSQIVFVPAGPLVSCITRGAGAANTQVG